MKNYTEINRRSWNMLTEIHAKSDFYNLSGFKNGECSLKHIEKQEIGSVNGKELLHLQCHFGMDTLSWERLGAEVTGVDISDESIRMAKLLTKKLGMKARFIRSDIFDIKQHLNRKFDIVFTSYGALNWLADLNRWAAIISDFLKPGGLFYIVDFHPLMCALHSEVFEVNSYFEKKPFVNDVSGTYTDGEVSRNENKHIEWQHTMGEIITSLAKNKLIIKQVNEFPYQVYNCFPGMVEIEQGKWVFEKFGTRFPYLFSIKATKNVS